MASYQEMDVRLAVVETKIDMLMKSVQIIRTSPTGMLDDKGAPVMRREQKSLLDIYREIQAAGAEVANPAPVVTES